MASAFLAMPRGSRLYGSPVVGSSTSQVMTRVVSAKNGSIVAVTGSGIRHMSDSLIAFQPAIDEPWDIRPSAKTSSSIMPTSKVTCCHLPRGSVKRRSTYFTSLSLIDFRTSLAVFMNTPFGYGSVSRTQRPRHFANDVVRSRERNQAAEAALFLFFSRKIRIAPGLDSVQPGFSRSDPDRFFDVGDEDFAVADATGLGSPADGVDGFLDQFVRNDDLAFDLVQEVGDDLLS